MNESWREKEREKLLSWVVCVCLCLLGWWCGRLMREFMYVVMLSGKIGQRSAYHSCIVTGPQGELCVQNAEKHKIVSDWNVCALM